MLIKKSEDIKSSEITDKKTYLSRRLFMRGAVLAASTAATTLAYRNLIAPAPQQLVIKEMIAGVQPASVPGGTTEEQPTAYEKITNYNNFYEFSTSKSAVAGRARGFVARPWTVSVEGLVGKPGAYDLDDLLKISAPEERIYRLRCVEGWSMVIPWVGFSLAKLLAQVEPLGSAKFVRFETLFDPERMPNQKPTLFGASGGGLDWPYVEGLRIDEAMHPLTILASGLYGEQLPPQDGAPLRLVVPWKYGFKSIKSIVKISLVAQQPTSTWSRAAPSEYGFYSNVNPKVSHPRWSQATERRIGEFRLRNTLPFNGYAEQVAHLYTGMNLKRFF